MSESFTEKFAKKKSDIAKKVVKKSEAGKQSFMDQLINSRGDLCYKITGRDITGKIAWYFVLIDKDKKEAFLKHEEGDSYNIEDYGKIIVSGYGEEVPLETQEMLREKYDFDNF